MASEKGREGSNRRHARVSSALVIVVMAVSLLTVAMATIPRRAAADWCPDASLYSNPSSGYQSETINEDFTLQNGRNVAVEIYWIHVTFSWDGLERDWGTMSIPAYGEETNTRSIMLPSSTGDYSVSVVANGQATGDWLSSECSWSGSFRVNALPPPPTILITANPSTGTAPLTVSLTATVSNGLGPFTYSWTFGDGSTGSGSSVSHTYSSSGVYTAQVLVTDSRSRSDSDSVTVTVKAASIFGDGDGGNLALIIIVIVIVVIVIAAIAAVALKRKGGRPPVQQHPAPQQYPPPPPQYAPQPPVQQPPYQGPPDQQPPQGEEG